MCISFFNLLFHDFVCVTPLGSPENCTGPAIVHSNAKVSINHLTLPDTLHSLRTLRNTAAP